MWKVSGIKIERTRARYFFGGDGQGDQSKTEFFTLRPVTRKRREILGWAIKGEKSGIHVGTEVLWAKVGCGVVLTLF